MKSKNRTQRLAAVVITACGLAGAADAAFYGGSSGNGAATPESQTPNAPQNSPSTSRTAPRDGTAPGIVQADGSVQPAVPVFNQSGTGGTGPGAVGADSSRNSPGNNEPPAPEPTMTPADAPENFKTVVESYVSRSSDDGVWTYVEKKSKSRLTLVSVDADGVRNVGKERYAGDATLRDERTKRLRRLRFTVDFSLPLWSVVAVRPSPHAPAK
jgi:hypothetical protein